MLSFFSPFRWAPPISLALVLGLCCAWIGPEAATAARPAPGDSLYHASAQTMGTTFDLYLYAPSRKRFNALFEAAYTEVKRVESVFSTYDPHSELSRINAQAHRRPVRTDPEVFGLLRTARAYGRRTDGAYDATVGPLVEAWGFFRGDGRRPTAAALRRARRQTGWENLVLDPDRRTVRFAVDSLKVDLGGLGKGYAIDQVAALLRRQGVEAALVGLGTSTYYALGAPPETPGWTIRVPSPAAERDPLTRIRLRDEALSTSGSDRQFVEVDGQTYSHIIDPRTGRPVQGRVQVTVVAPRATTSDALSTALFVLGAEDGRALILGHDDRRALLVEGRQAPRRLVPMNWDGPLTTSHSTASTEAQ